jgi:hypothetical protein
MPTGVIERSSDMSGAPVLTGIANEYVAMITAILATGWTGHPAAGWSIFDAAADRVALQMGGGPGLFTRIKETGADSFGKTFGQRGYETMSDVNTGTGPHPTTAQMSGDGMGAYYMDLTSVPRPWFAVADPRTAIIFTDMSDNKKWRGVYFGEIYSEVRPGPDDYRVIQIGGGGLTVGGVLIPGLDLFNVQTPFNGRYGSLAIYNSTPHHYMARRWDGTGGSVAAGKAGDIAKGAGAINSGMSNSSGTLDSNGTIPETWLSPIYIHDPSLPSRRGRLRGIWHYLHNDSNVADGDTLVGSGIYEGKTFRMRVGTPFGSIFAVEISDTWKTNT